ncbi:MAG TPA: hypothetical protein VLF79_00655 [Candidatus Saccharimonadales bacterium]|nr:hypothetical protein [Candidatus Saccharimonadales bacterium]
MSVTGERVVWKIGSNSNMDANGFRLDRLGHFANEFAEQIRAGHQPIAVLSGAVAMANAALLSTDEGEDERITDQMRATRGNAAFFNTWISALDAEDVRSGEFLVTHHELNFDPEANTFVHTIEDYLKLGWLPLINESGSTDDYETRKLVYGGDNDGLAEVVADKTKADRICFLTEEEGLIDSDGNLIKIVNASNTVEALEIAGHSENIDSHRGGIRTKVEAALLAASMGRKAHIAHAKHSFQAIQKAEVGTLFVPHYRINIVQ